MQRLSVSSRYRVLRRLHVGGMAEVFLAVSEGTIARRVIIKRMLPELARSEEMRTRFAEEARLLSLLAGPGLPAVYDAGEDDEGPFLIAEYVPGANLREVLDAGGVLAAGEVASLLSQATDILRRLHRTRDEQGRALDFVHRDLAPENLQLDRDGRLWLLDLGIAKSRESAVRTRAGVRQGRAAYMAPEQLLGRRAGAAADLYALALVGAELCGAKLQSIPDQGGVTPPGAIERLARMDAGERVHWPEGIDPALRETLEKMLVAEPDVRPGHDVWSESFVASASAPEALAARSQAAVAASGAGDAAVPGTPVLGGSFGAPSRGSPRKKIVAGWVALGVLVTGAGGWLLTPRGAAPAPKLAGAESESPVISEGQVEVAVQAPSPGVFALQVDGRPTGQVRGMRALQLDPGTHTIVLTEESTNRYYREDFLARLGETRLIRFPREWGGEKELTQQGEKEE